MKELKKERRYKVKKSAFVITALGVLPICFLLGLWLGDFVIAIESIAALENAFVILIKYGIATAAVVVGLALTAPVYLLLAAIANSVEHGLQKYNSKEILMGIIGLLMGVLLAVLIGLLIQLPTSTQWVAIVINVIMGALLGYLGLRIGSRILYDVLPATNVPRPAKISTTTNGYAFVLDASCLIDGRVLDVVRTGFLTGLIIIPNEILSELSRIADSEDELKRNRGRRGLDIVTALQKEKNVTVDVIQLPAPVKDADAAVIAAASGANARVITNDFNLAKFAAAQQIEVLNINDLSAAIKPIALPGESMTVKIVKRGKEAGQGVGFTADGTMIVVENGAASVGQELSVTVTTSLQSSSGRIIFTRIDV